MKALTVGMAVLAVAACAGSASAQTTVITPGTQPAVVAPAPAPAVAAKPGKYSGEVWTWDSARSIVTLYDGGKQFRVQVTPDQIARLDHHAKATVTGTLLGPEPIDTVMLPAQPMTAQPSGPAMSADVTGRISAIDTNGVAVVDSPRGPLRVWLADNPQSRFASGRPVNVHVSIQPVRMVAVAGGGGLASGPTMTVQTPTPGDQALVIGRILSVSPTGILSVESPRGPVSVWAPDASSFKVGDFVQVQTVVQPG
jgi:hypothetical protein